MSHFPVIYDSDQPGNVPTGVDALVYYGGDFNWPDDEIKRMRRIYRLTEIPGHPEWMRDIRGVAVELEACSVTDAIEACHARYRFRHEDFTVYTALDPGDDTAHQPGFLGIVQALRSHAPGLPFRVHVADWDSDPGYRPEADGVKAWAKQYAGNVHGGAYDLSALYGTNDLVRP